MTDALRSWRGKRRQLSVFLSPKVFQELKDQAAGELMSVSRYLEMLVLERSSLPLVSDVSISGSDEDQIDLLAEYSAEFSVPY